MEKTGRLESIKENKFQEVLKQNGELEFFFLILYPLFYE